MHLELISFDLISNFCQFLCPLAVHARAYFAAYSCDKRSQAPPAELQRNSHKQIFPVQCSSQVLLPAIFKLRKFVLFVNSYTTGKFNRMLYLCFSQQFSIISPTNRYTTLVPLVLVLFVGFCKESFEELVSQG